MEKTHPKPIVLIGAGGHAREVAEIVLESHRELGTPPLRGFLDQNTETHGTELHGSPVLGSLDWLESRVKEFDLIVAIGNNQVRRDLVEQVRALGGNFGTAISPRAYLSPRSRVGSGSMIFPGAVVSCDTEIGAHVILGTHSGVSHDSVVGNFGFLCPGARITGAVKLGEGVMLGTNSCVIPCRSVGDWTTVGAGGVVVENLPSGITAVGVPARALSSRATP